MPSHSALTVAVDVIGDMTDQPDGAGFRRVERFAGEHCRGDLARGDPTEDRHGDDRGGDADAHLGQRERGRGVHDDEVAGCHQTDPAGAHGAVHGRDRRPFGVHETFEDADHRPGVGWSLGALFEVGACTEGRTEMGQHDRSGVLLLGAVETLVELGQ